MKDKFILRLQKIFKLETEVEIHEYLLDGPYEVVLINSKEDFVSLERYKNCSIYNLRISESFKNVDLKLGQQIVSQNNRITLHS
jgi:hypothetical protein